MIPAELYSPIYIFVVFILSVFVVSKYCYCDMPNTRNDHSIAFVLAVLFTMFIGLRPNHVVFGDTIVYVSYYNNYLYSPFKWSSDVENLLFDNFLYYWASLRLGWSSFFLLISSFYFMGNYWACKRLFPNHTLAAFLFFLGAFSTYSYSVNGIKAGVAATLFVLAISYVNNKKVCVSLLLLSLGFHHSMTMPILVLLLVNYVHNPKYYFIGWIFCFFAALLHVTFFQILFSEYANSKGASYLTSTGVGWGGQTGFRYDFVLYSFMPILVGYVAIFKKQIDSHLYKVMLFAYLTLNSVWLLCMYVNFNNRIAYFSWLLYPFVLAYPFLDEKWGEKRFLQLGRVMFLHVAFTLIMTLK